MNKIKRKILGYLFLLIGTIGMAVLVVQTYLHQPIYTLNQYIDFIKNENYEKAANLITYNRKEPSLTQKELADYMKNYFQDIGLQKIKKGEKIFIQNKGNSYCYALDYVLEEKVNTSYIELVKNEGKWQVVFPFKNKDVYVFAPVGSKVFLDNKQVMYAKDGVYKAPCILEGPHGIRVEYPIKEKSSTSYTINVPEMTELAVAYDPHQVIVEVAKGLTVELADYKQESTKGKVIFDHVMEGDYTLKVYDEFGNIVPIEKSISVSKAKEHIVIDTLQLSSEATGRIKTFITDFYKAYLNGIEEADSSFLDKYTSVEKEYDLKKEFDEWFITNKKIEDAKLELELEAISLQKDGKIKVRVVENVKLINQEEKEQNKTEYYVLLNWSTFLRWDKENYSIEDRIIEESIVAYKDEKGNWIQY